MVIAHEMAHMWFGDLVTRPRSVFFAPPCILSARTVATITAAVGREPGLAAFDVEEFLRAEIGAEARFGHDDSRRA